MARKPQSWQAAAQVRLGDGVLRPIGARRARHHHQVAARDENRPVTVGMRGMGEALQSRDRMLPLNHWRGRPVLEVIDDELDPGMTWS